MKCLIRKYILVQFKGYKLKRTSGIIYWREARGNYVSEMVSLLLLTCLVMHRVGVAKTDSFPSLITANATLGKI